MWLIHPAIIAPITPWSSHNCIIRIELPEVKGFSERNLLFWGQFYKEYDAENLIVKQAISQLENMDDAKIEYENRPFHKFPGGIIFC